MTHHIALATTPQTEKRLDMPVIYTAIFVDDPVALVQWWRDNVGPTLENTYAHHMTIHFKPTEDQVESILDKMGEPDSMKIIGIACDDKAQAVIIQTDTPSNNEHKHITISTAKGIKPFYCNQLAAEATAPLDGPEIQGTIGAFSELLGMFTHYAEQE